MVAPQSTEFRSAFSQLELWKAAFTAKPGRHDKLVVKKPASVSPTIPALPGLPLLGNLLEFRRDRLAVQDKAAAFGPLVRFQMAHIPVYMATDADLAYEILVEKAASFRKSAGLQLLMPLLGDGLLTSEGATHKQHRKLLAPAFAPKRLAAYGDVMVDETRTQIAKWSPGDRIDISREMMEMTLAIAGKTLFHADVRDDADVVGRGLELAMHSMVAGLASPIQLGYRWPLRRHLQMKQAVAMLDEIVYRTIAEGRAAGTDRGDVLSMMLLAVDDENRTRLDDHEVRDEVMTLLLAGHETTANALTWTWYELGRNPGVVVQLEDEIRRVVGTRAVTVADLPNLPFTAAVIDEAMRLHPPAYMTGREALEDVTIGGHTIPAHSVITINIRGIHRRGDYFTAPLAFSPARMLPDVKKARPRHHYIPFGAGPRVCIGSHFALMEAQLALATMIQHAKLEVLTKHALAEPLVTLRPRDGMAARVVAC